MESKFTCGQNLRTSEKSAWSRKVTFQNGSEKFSLAISSWGDPELRCQRRFRRRRRNCQDPSGRVAQNKVGETGPQLWGQNALPARYVIVAIILKFYTTVLRLKASTGISDAVHIVVSKKSKTQQS